MHVQQCTCMDTANDLALVMEAHTETGDIASSHVSCPPFTRLVPTYSVYGWLYFAN